MSLDRPANRLAGETSPYLLQHAHNPVDWYPWGQDAFERARREDKPIFLSIGYSACHWCHVMERESFENDEIAAMLNRDFVSVKVDREERPDIDSIYMQAVQMMTGHGGWPMSMFLTPAGVPFFGGTYFPPDDSRGMPAFPRVLAHVANLYRNRRADVDAATAEMKEAIDRSIALDARPQPVTREIVEGAAVTIASSYDRVHGGFGTAPKFPPAMTLDFLLALASRGAGEVRDVILNTLRKMARGGIYDQIGGGFHRYSVDARWLVPHFEKMLYDNALLTRLYVHAWQWTGDPEFAAVVRDTLAFVEREMMSPEGGFYSTLDADSEGEEGRFYVWSREEVLDTLGEEEGGVLCALYDITVHGNFEGHNIPNVPRDPEGVARDLGISREQLDDIASRGRCKLFGRRAKRVRPARDEKILAGWNGWMLAAFAEASLATGGRYAAVVARSADFLVDRMMEGGRLFRSYKDGRRKIGGLLEDYAGVAWGLVHAFEATQQLRYLEAARTLALQILERFLDPEGAVFFDTPSDHEPLITRPKDLFDNATPSGNSLAIAVLFKLAVYYADETFERAARAAVEEIIPLARRFPTGFGLLLSAADWSVSTPKEIAITGAEDDPKRKELLDAVGSTYIPHRVIATSLAPSLPLMADKKAAQSLAYVCEHYACREPTADVARLKELLRT